MSKDIVLRSQNVFIIIEKRLFTTLVEARLLIFVILGGVILVQGILMLFWKPARKLGLWLFFITLTTICAIAGQVIDYVTRYDVPNVVADVRGRAYGDYGLSGSDYDHAESYNRDEGK